MALLGTDNIPSARPPRPLAKRGRRFALALASVLAVGLSGCQSMAVDAGHLAMVRVIAASPDAPGLDFYENGSAIAYNIGFGTVSSYVAYSPGAYAISTAQAGTRTQLTTTNASLANTRQYTALISNANASLQETILPDQNTPAPAGQIAVRVLNEATRIGGAVDVYLVPSSGKLSNSMPIATGLTFGSNSGYINVPAGTYAIAVTPTATVPTSGAGALYTGSQVAYSPGSVRTVVVIDQQIATSTGVQVLIAADFDSTGPAT